MVAKRRPAGQTAVFKLLQTTLYFDLHRSNACCLLHNTTSEDPEQIAVFNSPVLQQYPKNGCGLNLVAAAASCARAREHAGICNTGRPAGFENETEFLSSRYGYKTVAEHRTNLIAL